MKKCSAWLLRHKNVALMAVLTLALLLFLFRPLISPKQAAQTVHLPLVSSETALSPLEAFRMSRDNGYQQDVSALEALVSAEQTESATRQSAANALEALIARHQTQLALEGALSASALAPCCAVVTDGSLTIVTEKKEITQADTALVITLAKTHAGLDAANVQILTAE